MWTNPQLSLKVLNSLCSSNLSDELQTYVSSFHLFDVSTSCLSNISSLTRSQTNQFVFCSAASPGVYQSPCFQKDTAPPPGGPHPTVICGSSRSLPPPCQIHHQVLSVLPPTSFYDLPSSFHLHCVNLFLV